MEHHRTPIGIGESEPRLSWTILDAPPGWRQTAYEIETVDADTVAAVTRILSAESVLRPWPATPLRSRQRLRVRVGCSATTWSPTGASPLTSKPACSTRATGQHNSSAQPTTPTTTRPTGRGRPGCFAIRSRLPGPCSGRASIPPLTACTNSNSTANAVGAQTLAPGWTSYLDRLRYQTFDVDDLLRQGDNAIGGWLADGWFRGRIGFHGGIRDFYGDRTALLAQLEIIYADGSMQRSGPRHERWNAPVRSHHGTGLYEGETYDARRETAGLVDGFDDVGHGGRPSPSRRDPTSGSSPRLGPPVRSPKAPSDGHARRPRQARPCSTFGQNIWSAGCASPSPVPPATKSPLRHAEVLEDGELCTRPLRAGRRHRHATCSPATGPARRGNRASPSTASATPRSRLARRRRQRGRRSRRLSHATWSAPAGSTCSNPLLNRLHENVVWSMRGNFVDVPTDCPQRDERLGWTGDIQVFAPTASFLYDCAGLLASWLQDLAVEQRPRRHRPLLRPGIPARRVPDSARRGLGRRRRARPVDAVRALRRLDVLATQYRSMRQRWVDQIAAWPAPIRLWNTGFQLGDWLDPTAPPDRPGVDRDRSLPGRDRLLRALTHVSWPGSPSCSTGTTTPRGTTRLAAAGDAQAFAAEYVTPVGPTRQRHADRLRPRPRVRPAHD